MAEFGVSAPRGFSGVASTGQEHSLARLSPPYDGQRSSIARTRVLGSLGAPRAEARCSTRRAQIVSLPGGNRRSATGAAADRDRLQDVLSFYYYPNIC